MSIIYLNHDLELNGKHISSFRVHDSELNFLTDLPGGLDFNEWLASHSESPVLSQQPLAKASSLSKVMFCPKLIEQGRALRPSQINKGQNLLGVQIFRALTCVTKFVFVVAQQLYTAWLATYIVTSSRQVRCNLSLFTFSLMPYLFLVALILSIIVQFITKIYLIMQMKNKP